MKYRVLLVALFLLIVLSAGIAGAQGSNEGALTILMASPGEGEMFYFAADGVRLAVPITGQVVSYDRHLDLATTEVTVELINDAGDRVQLNPTLDDSGHFEIWALVSGDKPFPSDDPHDIEYCARCHRWNVDTVMPEGVSQVMVTARAADGRTGSVTRHLRVDRGYFRDLIVQIDGLPGNAGDVQISAATLVYNWRIRTALGNVVDDQAILQVEGLTYGNLTYEVSLVPQVIHGTRYTARPVTVLVSGQDTATPTVTLHAEAEQGTLAGTVIDGRTGDGVPAEVLAVSLATGETQTITAAEDGTFTFEHLPVVEHVLLARRADGFHLPLRFDLAETPQVETRIHLTPAGSSMLRGTVTLDGTPLPFAQVDVEGLPPAHADPVSGQFELDAVNIEEAISVTVTAAGCYSAVIETTDRDLGEIALALHDDTQVIEHDGVRLYIPAQSAVNIEDNIVDLQRGVLWLRGSTSAPADVLQVTVGEYMIAGANASFAVERLPNAYAWLYVSDGTTKVTHRGEEIHVSAGHTLTLGNVPAQPVELVPDSGSLLRAVAGPVAYFELAPTAGERLSDAALQVSVAAAQVLMLLAYAITFVLLPAVLITGVIVIVRRQRTRA